MIVRNEGDIPNEEDRIFFTKILWVILERIKGNYEFLPCAEKELQQKLHAKQVSLLIKKAKDWFINHINFCHEKTIDLYRITCSGWVYIV